MLVAAVYAYTCANSVELDLCFMSRPPLVFSGDATNSLAALHYDLLFNYHALCTVAGKQEREDILAASTGLNEGGSVGMIFPSPWNVGRHQQPSPLSNQHAPTHQSLQTSLWDEVRRYADQPPPSPGVSLDRKLSEYHKSCASTHTSHQPSLRSNCQHLTSYHDDKIQQPSAYGRYGMSDGANSLQQLMPDTWERPSFTCRSQENDTIGRSSIATERGWGDHIAADFKNFPPGQISKVAPLWSDVPMKWPHVSHTSGHEAPLDNMTDLKYKKRTNLGSEDMLGGSAVDKEYEF